MKITIGLTRTDREANYVPAMDGYRPGAAQDVVELELDYELEHPEPDWQALQVAEAVFTATNAPREVVLADPLAHAIYHALTLWNATNYMRGHRLSLSVGDTVAVDGARLACESLGWKVVA